MGIKAIVRLQLASSMWRETIHTQLDAVKASFPKDSPFRCIAQKSVTLLWANIPQDWTRLRGENGNTLLHIAVVCPVADILKFVLSRPRAEELANVPNGAGKVPLHVCATRGICPDPILALSGVDIERRDHYDATALILATREEHFSCVGSLLQHRADANAFAMYTGPRLATALSSAVSLNNEAMVKLLLRAPDILVSQPLLLGVPGAPTAREFAKTERMRQLLLERAAQEGSRSAADPGFFASCGIPTTSGTSGGGPDLGISDSLSETVDDAMMHKEEPHLYHTGKQAIASRFLQRVTSACISCLPCGL